MYTPLLYVAGTIGSALIKGDVLISGVSLHRGSTVHVYTCIMLCIHAYCMLCIRIMWVYDVYEREREGRRNEPQSVSNLIIIGTSMKF